MKVLAVVLLVVGVVLVAVGIVYLVEPAKHLPSFFPGHSHSHHHGTKQGLVALVVGVIALIGGVVGWRRSAAPAA